MRIPHPAPKSLLLFLPALVFSLSIAFQSELTTRLVQAEESGASSVPRVSRPQSPSSADLKPKSPSTLRKIFNFLKCNEAKLTKEKELSRTGPQFPPSYDDSDFSIVALVKGNWPVVVEFELELEGTATMTFTVKDVEPFTQILQGKEIGTSPSNSPAVNFLTRAFRLPERFGDKPQAALITIKAVTDAAGKIPADFQFHGLGIGDSAPKTTSINRSGLQPAGVNAFQVKAAFRHLDPDYNFGGSAVPPNAMIDKVQANKIVSVNVTPNTVSPTGAFKYTFVSTDRFGRWKADFHRKIKVLRNGKPIHGTRPVKTDRFNELVSIGVNPRPAKSWVVKRERLFEPGEYRIQVTAFSLADAANGGGQMAVKVSGPLTIN